MEEMIPDKMGLLEFRLLALYDKVRQPVPKMAS